ncbi:hypothetical protein [Oceanirhabdus seepicola]|uniref:Uncharacterized protein n=1 Tax=Oceanirhabdus seepicola TaxID=2828781 RepID=A0A9J6NZ72_9CLOT|nr:hypothetical protein [Oceanirhabdus seepicola]MCM1989372.1 hypothetical protein [Oceanirhabdus seepicola]
MKEVVKNTYEELKLSNLKITKEAVEEMDTLLAEYNYVLKSDNEDPSQKVNDLKFKITEEVFTKVEEYYFKN